MYRRVARSLDQLRRRLLGCQRYTAMMLKKAAIVVALLVIALTALLRFTGLRIALDGSGFRPRWVSRQPDYAALEADRARQRQLPVAVAPDLPTAEPPPANPAQPAHAGTVSSSEPSTPAAARRDGYWPDFRG